MQINLKSHPFVFKSLSIAFDEVTNIAYAAKFLKGLYNRHKSWAKAVAYYHSTNPLFYRSYMRKVYKTLRSSPLPPPLLQGLVRFSPYRPESASAFKPNDLPLVTVKLSVKPFIKVRSYQIKLISK